MIETADAEQTLVLHDNRGNVAEIVAYYDDDDTVVLTVNTTDGVELDLIALALVNYAGALTEDSMARTRIAEARRRLMHYIEEEQFRKQNGQSVNQDDCPF